MAALLPALLALLGAACALEVQIEDPRTVALLFQPVLLRCRFRTDAPDPPPIVTWKYKSFCPSPSPSSDTPSAPSNPGADPQPCPDSARTVRIVATKQGGVVTLGDFYRGRAVTILGGAELSLGPAAWGDSGLYVCTVTSTADLQGNNEALAELLVLGSLSEATELFPGLQFGTLPDWLFVVLVALGVLLGALVLGLCWCQCCPHSCCCLLRCPCCPQRCCCPEALYLAGKAATSGGLGGVYAPPPPLLPLQTLESSRSSQVPLLRDSRVTAPPPAVLRYLEEQMGAWDPPSRAGPPPSDISSLHEAPDSWTPPRRPPRGTSPPPPPAPKARWRSEEFLGGSREGGRGGRSPPQTPPPSRPRSRSRDDLLGGRGGWETPPRRTPLQPPPRRMRKHDALSRESLVV